jgi:ribA/ribD-fused uncharacterized protein
MSYIAVSPRSVDELRRIERAGSLPPFLFFWGHRPAARAAVDRSCLSQWWPARFTVDGVGYASAEHYMMEQKARLFGDDAAAARVLAAASPGAAKAIGRQIRGFDEDTWRRHRYPIVLRGNTAKFSQHRPLGDYLLGTGRRIIAEASPVDRVWGIGLVADDDRARRPSAWRGLNLLGFALMEVRGAVAGAVGD